MRRGIHHSVNQTCFAAAATTHLPRGAHIERRQDRRDERVRRGRRRGEILTVLIRVRREARAPSTDGDPDEARREVHIRDGAPPPHEVGGERAQGRCARGVASRLPLVSPVRQRGPRACGEWAEDAERRVVESLRSDFQVCENFKGAPRRSR